MSLAEMMRTEVRSQLLALNVLRPGRVEEYDGETQTATIQPLLMPVHTSSGGEEVAVTPPPIQGVPVWWPRWGGFQLVGELVPGDVVGLIHADRALDGLLAQSATDTQPIQPVDPKDARAHDLSDAVAIPGLLLTQVGAQATAPVVLRHLSGALAITIGPDGSVTFALGGEADQPAVRGTVLATYLAALDVWARTHTHVAPPGGGATGPAAPAPPQVPQDLLSALLRLR